MTRSPDTLADDLAALLDDPRLPDRARARGQRLLQRATAPVQVAVVGPAGAGKRTLINMALEQRILPGGGALPPLRLGHGREPALVAVDGAGHRAPLDPRALADGTPPEVELLDMSQPIALLREIAFLRIDLPADPAEAARRLAWMSRRADIVLYCNQGFGPDEATAWAGVPDGIKDHAFFVLTRADLLAAQGRLPDHMAALAGSVAAEFHSLYPLAGRQALKARLSGDERAFRASGGAALMSELRAHARTGRAEDRDKAAAFLRDYGAFVRPAPAPRPAKAQPAPAGAAAPAPSLRPSFAQLAAELEKLPVRDAPAILARCAEAAARISADLSDAPEADPALIDDVMQISEMITLYQFEANEDAAIDAACLLAQLAQETERHAAA